MLRLTSEGSFASTKNDKLMKINYKLPTWILGLVMTASVVGCHDDDNSGSGEGENNGDKIVLKNHSKTPAFVYAMPGFEKLEIFLLFRVKIN